MPNKLKALDTTPPHPASTGRHFALRSACWQPASSTAVSHPPGVGLVTPLCQTRCVSGFHSSVQVHVLFDPAASFPPSSSSTAVLTSSWTKQHVFRFDDVTTGSWRGSQTSPGCCHHSHLLQSAAQTASSSPPPPPCPHFTLSFGHIWISVLPHFSGSLSFLYYFFVRYSSW